MTRSFDEFTLGSVLLDLPKPEYAAAPEVLLSSLVWQSKTIERLDLPSAKKPIGLVFRSELSKTPKAYQRLQTAPQRDELRNSALKLEEFGISGDSSLDSKRKREVAEGFLNSIVGNRPSKATGVPAAPMTLNLALLQNPIGMVGKAHPVNFALVLSKMFHWGRPNDFGPKDSCLDLWLQGQATQVKDNQLLQHLDEFAEYLLLTTLKQHGYGIRDRESDVKSFQELPEFLGDSPTPFRWFFESWTTLTSESWAGVLTPRIWTDWLLTVLRTAFSFGYLWYCHYYSALGRYVFGDPSELENLARGNYTILPWVSTDLPEQQRNIQPAIRETVRRGVSAQKAFSELISDDAVSEVSLETTLGHLREHPSDFKSLYQVLYEESSRMQSTYRNTRESILYSLRERESKDGPSDFYAFLHKISDQLSVIDPGTEWITLLTSLACKTPDGETTLGKLKTELGQLGLLAPARDLVQLLEVAGLATGSADADEGVRIKGAF